MTDLANEFPDLFKKEPEEPSSQEVQPSQSESDEVSNVEKFKKALAPHLDFYEAAKDGTEIVEAVESFTAFLDSKDISDSSIEVSEDPQVISVEFDIRYGEYIIACHSFYFHKNKDVMWSTKIYLVAEIDTQDVLMWSNLFNSNNAYHSGTFVNTERQYIQYPVLISRGSSRIDKPGVNILAFKFATNPAIELREVIDY